MRRISFIILFVCSWSLYAQDSSLVLTEKQFFHFIENYHPIAQKALLIEDKGRQKLKKARGGFDPKIGLSRDEKNYDDKLYYQLIQGGLKIPTWYGVELKAGAELNKGLYVNPESNVPDGGLVFAGVALPLVRNLLMDKRRAALKQANIYMKSTEAQQAKILNDLYFDAFKAYWKWVETWNELQIYEEGVLLASDRFKAVKMSFIFGDKPAIDTLEGFIQVQNRTINRNQARIKYRNASLELSNYLWTKDNLPLEITDALHPSVNGNVEVLKEMDTETYLALLAKIEKEHPEMELYAYKMDTYKIDQRLKRENLKPKVNLNYNVLNEPLNGNVMNQFSSENYKWGVDVAIPIFMRKEIGDLRLVQIKMKETEISIREKNLALQNKMNAYYNEHLNMQEQMKLNSAVVVNYERLLDGEKQRFDSGESSLFLVNSRESSLIKAQLKLNKMTVKYHITHAGVLWAAGTLFESL